MLLSICSIFVVVLVSIYIYFQYAFTYWKRNGVPDIAPEFPFGNIKDITKEDVGPPQMTVKLYREFKKKRNEFGGAHLLCFPIFFLVSPDMIKSVLSKDFTHFHDRKLYWDEKTDPLSAHLFSLPGEKWRRIRTNVTPNFTALKMKLMFSMILEIGQELDNVIDSYTSAGEPINIEDLMKRFTTDTITSSAFGLKSNSLKNPNEEFVKYGNLFIKTSFTHIPLLVLSFFMPSIMKLFKIPFTNKKVTKFFLGTIKETVKYREANNINRRDFLDFFIKLTKKTYVDDNGKVWDNQNVLTVNEIAAQAFAIFLGGYETSSTVLTFCFYELALHQYIQNKLRDEVLRVLNKYDGEITYESLMEMTYMNQVIQETLRKYPTVPIIHRQCTQPFKIPGTDIKIDKGVICIISALGLHRDPEYFPDPEKFDPERFCEKEKEKIHPFTYLPFGEGPRICIGIKFAYLQMKIALVKLLMNKKVLLDPNTTVPIELNTRGVLLSPKTPVWLLVRKIHDVNQ